MKFREKESSSLIDDPTLKLKSNCFSLIRSTQSPPKVIRTELACWRGMTEEVVEITFDISSHL